MQPYGITFIIFIIVIFPKHVWNESLCEVFGEKGCNHELAIALLMEDAAAAFLL